MGAVLHTLAEIRAAGAALGSQMPPLSQGQANYVHALTAPELPRIRAAQAASHAA